jgi:hypothetical protein
MVGACSFLDALDNLPSMKDVLSFLPAGNYIVGRSPLYYSSWVLVFVRASPFQLVLT